MPNEKAAYAKEKYIKNYGSALSNKGGTNMANCKQCGAPLDENSKFCTNCGASSEAAADNAAPVNEETVSGTTEYSQTQQTQNLTQQYIEKEQQQQQYQQYQQYQQAQQTYNSYSTTAGDPDAGKGMAIASLVCGIVGVVFFFFGVSTIISLILGILGVIFAGQAKKKGNTTGMRTAGFIISLVSLIGGAIIFICVLSCAGAVGCAACAGAMY